MKKYQTFIKLAKKINYSKVTIIGGNGYLGKEIVKKIKPLYKQVVVASRNIQEIQIENVSYQKVNLLEPNSIQRVIEGSDTVINCSNIINEYDCLFKELFVDGTHHLVIQTKKIQAKYIHFSCIGASLDSLSHYADFKFRGEDKAYSMLPNSVIIRPNIIYSNENPLLKRLSKFPFISGGNKLVQPVHIDDVVKALEIILQNNIQFKVFDLSGPEQMTFLELLRFYNHSKMYPLLSCPLAFAKAYLAPRNYLPNPFLSYEIARVLEYDLISENENGFKKLGIQPKNIL